MYQFFIGCSTYRFSECSRSSSEELILKVYPNIDAVSNWTDGFLCERAILAPKNCQVDAFNFKLIANISTAGIFSFTEIKYIHLYF